MSSAETGNISCSCGGEYVIVQPETDDHRLLACQQCEHLLQKIPGAAAQSDSDDLAQRGVKV